MFERKKTERTVAVAEVAPEGVGVKVRVRATEASTTAFCDENEGQFGGGKGEEEREAGGGGRTVPMLGVRRRGGQLEILRDNVDGISETHQEALLVGLAPTTRTPE